ncbi:MAG: LysM peptidoglycan-binding domain-containing protein [Patescibacteria group bacterium]|jgi:hypothetical protein
MVWRVLFVSLSSAVLVVVAWLGLAAKSTELPLVSVGRYIVAPGDTYEGIAQRFGVAVADLDRWNAGALQEEYLFTCAGVHEKSGHFCNDSVSDPWRQSLRPGLEIDVPLPTPPE